MKIFIVVAQLALSIFLLGIFMARFDCQSILEIIGSPSGFESLLAGTGFVLLQYIIGGIRFPYILKLYQYSLSMFTSLRICLIGNFLSQIVVSFVSGDAMRVWFLTRMNIPVRPATSATLLDRIMGFIALMILFLVTLPFLLDLIQTPMMRYNILMLALISVIGIVCFFLLGKLPAKRINNRLIHFIYELSSNSRYLKESISDSIISLLWSIVVHLLNGFGIYCLFCLYSVNVDLLWCMVLSIPFTLVTSLPISFSGWGVRESFMVTAFGLLGLPEEKILVVSITLGISALLASLPGAVFLLFERNRQTFSKLQPSG